MSFDENNSRQFEDGRIYGVVRGIVIKNDKDELGLGRVKLQFSWWDPNEESNWARVTTFMAGKEFGAFYLPEPGDEVLVAFEHGEINRPFVIGALWTKEAKPPLNNSDGKNNFRIIKSKSGHIIRLDDTDGNEKIEIIDKTGKNLITFDSKENTINIKSEKDIVLEAPNGKISVSAKSIDIQSSAESNVKAGSNMDIGASEAMNIKGSSVNIN